MSQDRREFLVNGMQVACSLSLAALVKERFFGPGVEASYPLERTLVVVQLSGGNDGLNTLVPHRQDAYYRLRPTLALPSKGLHMLDDDFGLHPEMGALAELFEQGQAAALHSVGYPHPDRSHFRSMEIWHTANPEHQRTAQQDHGWLGSLCDRFEGGASMRGIHIGGVEIPLALRGQSSAPTAVTDARGMQLRQLEGLERTRNRLAAARPREPHTTRYLRTVAQQSYDVAARLTRAFDIEASGDAPDHPLARRLRLAANLISAGFGLRVFHLELDGFDTHAQQARTHDALLRELSESLAFFQRELASKGLDDMVTTLVFSEFGRRTAENGSKGTDHGAAAPAFLLGKHVRPGLHGKAPNLEALENGDLPHHIDFRSIYAALERDWMDTSPQFDLEPQRLFI